MTRLFLVLLLTSVLMVQGNGDASAEKAKLSKEEAGKVLSFLAPGLKVLSVAPAPVEGLWEVVLEAGGKKGIVYIDSSRKNILLGSIVDVATKVNLTKERFDDINRVDLSTIPLDDALVLGNPKAKHRVIVFDDPD